jgi:adenylate kinase
MTLSLDESIFIMNIIILGPQGSGKGTQAKLLSDKFGLTVAEAGRLIRKASKSDPKISEIINKKGQLIPAEDAFRLIAGFIEKKDPEVNNFLLDGYPRSIKQYELLKAWLKKKNTKIDLVIFLNISGKETVKRLSARRVCEQCGTNYNLITNPPPKGDCECGGKLIQREDDKPQAIKKRLAEYKKRTEPVISMFRNEGILEEVDGERPIETIFEDLLKIIKNDREN